MQQVSGVSLASILPLPQTGVTIKGAGDTIAYVPNFTGLAEK
jgi:hypothetical protein